MDYIKQVLIHGLFTPLTITGDFTSSAVFNRFLSESIDFGPVYTVYTASAPILTEVEVSSTLPTQPSTTFTCPSLLTNTGTSFSITVTPPTSTTNYSSSLEFVNPPATTNQSDVPWATVVAGATGTGTTTLTVSYQNGDIAGTSVYFRSCRLHIFEEIDGVMTPQIYPQSCWVSQQYLFSSSGGGIGGGGGGIPEPVPNT